VNWLVVSSVGDGGRGDENFIHLIKPNNVEMSERSCMISSIPGV
jgi:hypothetical protein